MTEKHSLLSDMRILDMADEKGSFCSRLLADMGAYVIKVERVGGDPSRGIGPFQGETPHPDRSLSFNYNNMNKFGITLDVEQEKGREIFLRLAKRTDIIMETFPPGYIGKIGLGYEVLRDLHPGLILVSITGFGQDGPRCGYKSCDLVASAYGGQMFVSGSPSTPPLKPFGEQSYYAASLYGAIGSMLALRKRGQTGRGEHVDISLQESALSTLDHVMVRYFFEKEIPEREGSLSWNRFSCILPCKDGHVLLTPFQEWETMVQLMEADGMAEDLTDGMYAQEEYRLEHMDHVITVLERWSMGYSTKALFDLGQAMRLPWAPIRTPKDVLNCPQLKDRGFFIEGDSSGSERLPAFPGRPYRSNVGVFRPWKRAPHIGEDNILIYQKELGLSSEEFDRLAEMKVI